MRLFFAALTCVAVTSSAFAGDIKLTGENTKITFVGTKPGGKHEGGFKTLTGTASISGETISKVEVEIETDSLFSDDAKLTQHLKAPDFFNVKANPKAMFVSTKVEKTDKGTTITGDLTLNGKTKSISFPATIAARDKASTLKIDSEFKINKNDFGMTYGGGKIDDMVAIKVSVDAK